MDSERDMGEFLKPCQVIGLTSLGDDEQLKVFFKQKK